MYACKASEERKKKRRRKKKNKKVDLVEKHLSSNPSLFFPPTDSLLMDILLELNAFLCMNWPSIHPTE